MSVPLKHLYLIDGSGFIFRAFHGLPMMTRSDGVPTNAVYGFATMLARLMTESDADHLAVIFDAGRKTFRNEIYPDYKAHRPPAPEELVPQFPLIREAVEAFGVAQVELEGFEADDLIAAYAELALKQGARVTVVSSDKDLMQLIRPNVGLLDPLKNKKIGEAEVIEKFGVPPDKVVDVQALIGDPTDNVPGVPGIGVKTAAELIGLYGDLDGLLAKAHEIKQPKRRETLLANRDKALMSRELVRLKADAPTPLGLAAMERRLPDPARLRDFFNRMEFRSLLAKLGPGLAAGPAAPTAPAPASAQTSYELIQDEERLKVWVGQAQSQGLLAVDTETSGLDALSADLVGVSLALGPGKACYIPLGHEGKGSQGDLLSAPTPRPKQIPLATALEILKPLLEDDAVLKIGQNIKYDRHVLARHGIDVAPFDDTMLISYVLDGSLHGHGMDELAKLHLDRDTIKFETVCGKGKEQIGFAQVEMDKALAYAAEDADVTFCLHQTLKPRLAAQRLVGVYEELERPLVPVLGDMERLGIKIDMRRLSALGEDFAKRMAISEVEAQDLAGRPFNIGSPKQLGEVLFDEMSLPGGKKSAKTGAWGTDASVLEGLAAEGHALPAKVLEWRQLAKLKSTYIDALIGMADRNHRVHTSFSQAVTSTGRLSSSEPNLQNIPIRTEEGRKIRTAFIAEPGHVLISADYSQIELRLVAHVADVKALKDAFAMGADIHASTASQVFGVPIEGMDPSLRRQAKAINFGIIYGMGAFGLSQQLGIPVGEASRFIEAYLARFPEIRIYMERTKETAKTRGYVTTLFGRRCHTPGINSKNPNERGFAERAAINAPIQGGAADIIKRAMIRLPAALLKAGLKTRLLLQVHDELVLEAPESEAPQAAALVKSVMEGAVSLSVPLIAETGIGSNWGEAH
ncbi:DNA polymerase I [Rhodospirillaceae bacterium LM-1]|nr:DNA polymerase I [Rhodospirillaceae bacterium LM-1]